MKKTGAALGLFLCVVTAGSIISGCAHQNPSPINTFDLIIGNATIEAGTVTNEGASMTVRAVIGRQLGMPITLEAIGVFFMPRSFSFRSDRVYVSTTVHPRFDNYLRRVTAGPAVDGFELTKQKLRVEIPAIISYEAAGYDWWIGVSKDPIVFRDGDTENILGTIESGCAGTFEVFFFNGITYSMLNTPDFRGAGRAHVISASSNQVLGSSQVGLLSGLVGSITISDDGERVFVLSFPNFADTDVHLASVIGTHFVTILDGNGDRLKTIVLPQQYGGNKKYNLSQLMCAGGKLYVLCGVTDGSVNGDIRIYDASFNETDYPLDVVVPFVNPPTRTSNMAATSEGGTNRVYAIAGGSSDKLVILTDNGIPTHEVMDLPYRVDSVSLLESGEFALAGGNNVLIYDSSKNLVVELTPEASAIGCEPGFAIKDPSAKMLYITEKFDMGSPGSRIWKINYGAATPTVETVFDTTYPFYYFDVARGENRLYVAVPDKNNEGNIGDGGVITIDTVTGGMTFTNVEGVPFSVACSNGRVYVANEGFTNSSEALENWLFVPPERFGYKVKVYSRSGAGLSHYTDIDVGYSPTLIKSNGGKVAVISGAIPSIYFDLASQGPITFLATASPEIINTFINGGHVVSNDKVSGNGTLTADLQDNSGIWSARVVVDGVDRTANTTFTPDLPANKTSHLSLSLGNWTAGTTHSITIETTDGQLSAEWSVFDLVALDGGRVGIIGEYPAAYPAPFRPLSGNPQENTLRIAYILTVDAPIMITAVDITGRAVFTRKYPAGMMGGRAGYNEVTWDGRAETGGVVGNGIYPYKIISKGRVIGSGKVVVYDR